MIRCTFHLNGGQMSTLSCPGLGFFPAYSGHAGANRNNPDAIALKKKGPLPPGKYFIVTRSAVAPGPDGTICSKNWRAVQIVTFGLRFTGMMGL